MTDADVVLQAFRAVGRRDRAALLALYHPEVEFQRVIADRAGEVVVRYRQRALDGSGKRFDAPVLGLYEIRDGSSRARRCSTSTLRRCSTICVARHPAHV
jgi:hypothetical protein